MRHRHRAIRNREGALAGTQMRCMRRRHSLAAIACALLSLAASQAVAADALRSPYSGAPSLPQKQQAVRICPQVPEPIRDLAVVSAFAHGDYTRMDATRTRTLEEAVKPLHAYLGTVADLADKAMLSNGPAREAARKCALLLLQRWAEAGALLGDVAKPQGGYERKWALASISLAYQKLYAGEAMPAPSPEITQWIKALGDLLPPDYPASAFIQNNHFYWAGLTAMAAATVIDDRQLYDWGSARIHAGLHAIDKDGFLPLELLRGQYALGYHSFAAEPLVMAALFEKANGHPLAGAEAEALDRLVHRTLSGLSDPAAFEQRSGKKQALQAKLSGRVLPWLEVYDHLAKDALAESWIAALRPMGHIWLGGDTTSAFGRPLPAGPLPPTPFDH